jgi:phosphotriesterase-related protein
VASTEGVALETPTAMTVLGPVPVADLGVVLTHEHVLSDVGCNAEPPTTASAARLFREPLGLENLRAARDVPMCNRDNLRLDDVAVAVDEVAEFKALGGGTIVDVTPSAIGRDPAGLQRISRSSGLHIVMGAGWYIDASIPVAKRQCSVEDIATEIIADITDGVGPDRIRAGIIGEVGIDLDFTELEMRSLRGAARAAAATGVPLSVHTPGGSPRAHEHRRRIVDVVREEGAEVERLVLDHVALRPSDLDSQMEFASRGAYLSYDNIGCDFDWGARGSGPCDHESAESILQLVRAGFGSRILVSQDVHLKVMLQRFGGGGYGHILRTFVPRLRSMGLDDDGLDLILRRNPARLFGAPA